jgi:two-component system chemotaxis response regulator CheY
MPKSVLLVGHCGPDNSYLRMAVRAASADANIITADSSQEVANALADGVDLLLVNRVLEYGFDHHNGVDLIKHIHALYPKMQLMLVSNYPEAQAAAVAAGAIPGFGKREIGSRAAATAISKALEATIHESHSHP